MPWFSSNMPSIFTPFWSIVTLDMPTLSVIDCSASMLISPRSALTLMFPIFTSWVSLPMLTMTSRLPF